MFPDNSCPLKVLGGIQVIKLSFQQNKAYTAPYLLMSPWQQSTRMAETCFRRRKTRVHVLYFKGYIIFSCDKRCNTNYVCLMGPVQSVRHGLIAQWPPPLSVTFSLISSFCNAFIHPPSLLSLVSVVYFTPSPVIQVVSVCHVSFFHPPCLLPPPRQLTGMATPDCAYL